MSASLAPSARNASASVSRVRIGSDSKFLLSSSSFLKRLRSRGWISINCDTASIVSSTSRTRDGGKTFKSLKKGLPQKHAYDLIFRHGLAIDRPGERLAMGSTTGGVWVSEDQGDSWQNVTHSLPPVYAVRFA